MSKGLGRVQRLILTAFQDAAHPAFNTRELCFLVYGSKDPTKGQRVAVLRAVRSLANGPLPTLWQWIPEFEKTDTVWYDYARLPARGLHRTPAAKRPAERT